MNITPNYQLKMFNLRVNSQQLKTNPSFGMKQYVAPTIVTLTGTAASAIAAAILTKPNLDKPEETEVKIPTREEFDEMLKKFGTETIDSMIDLRRKDGSFIYNNHKAPYKNEVEAYTEHNKSFVDLCNIKLASGEYVNPDLASSKKLIKAYECAPEETIKLLQMPMPSSPATNRFSPDKINTSTARIYRYIPKTFKAIANMTDSSGKYRFGLEDIEEFTCCGFCFDINTMKPKEMDDKLLKNIGKLAKVLYRDKFQEGRYLTSKEILLSLAAYNKYPKETIEIIQNYRYYGDKPFTPDIQEVELYINNKEKFNSYRQEERDTELEHKLAQIRAKE